MEEKKRKMSNNLGVLQKKTIYFLFFRRKYVYLRLRA